MNPDMHFTHDDHEEHSTYEDGMPLTPKEKMILLSIVAGLGLLMVLVLIGIGF
ncbi:hypothetical protein [Cerasicoccus maritimus]|uniref:hypothetical protein n=1 Tax=Cerasicoccus maritimus TaxID=490089 RepID=UPI0028524FC8|nr:hypothetical protein [Cerasicoccus maritimus]